MLKLSVIMPIHLGMYEGAMPDREANFVSAVESFLKCKYENSELIIVADGCVKTMEIVAKRYKRLVDSGKIKLIYTDKHELFDGAVRQMGVDNATGNWICYLDSDDLFAPHHLHNLASCVGGYNTASGLAMDWVYFNAFWFIKVPGNPKKQVIPFSPDLEKGKINTGCIAHRKGVNARWDGFIGKQENWFFIEQLVKNHPINYKKIWGMGYLIQNAQVTKMEKQ